MTTDFRALCARMADELDHYRQLLTDDRRELHPLATEARAVLAEPEPEAEPTLREEFTMILNEARCNLPGRVIGNIELARRLTAAVDRFRRAQPEPEGPTDDAELRVAYEQGAEARRREGFPESFSLTDMERASKTAGLRAVLARWGK